MRRAFGYTGAWVAATLVAVTLSWFGCTVVLHGAAPAPLPALAGARAQPDLPPEQAAVDPTMIAVQPAQTSTPAPRTSTAPRTSRSTRPQVPNGTQTYVTRGTPPPHSPQPVPPGSPLASPSPTSSGAPTAVEQVYDVTGGTATLRFSSGQVEAVSVQPSPGYRVYLEQSRPDELVVIFSRPGQESDLHAAWDGEPSANVTEYWW